MQKLFISLALKYARPMLTDLLLNIVIPALEKKTNETDNKIDDEVVKIVKTTIITSLK